MPGATKGYNSLTMCLTSSTVSGEGVQEVAVVLNLLAISIREHSQLVGAPVARSGGQNVVH
jgi:hypothetical protein